jgi:hypothetical protein
VALGSGDPRLALEAEDKTIALRRAMAPADVAVWSDFSTAGRAAAQLGFRDRARDYFDRAIVLLGRMDADPALLARVTADRARLSR